jgi:GT2 family glycosyltransferase
MDRFGMRGRWALHALHTDGRCYGLSESRLRDLYASAELLINLHGGTTPRPEHAATGRLIYVGTDPVEREVELFDGKQDAVDLMAPHAAFFTWGENYGRPDCRVPFTTRFDFKPTRQPVVLDFWNGSDHKPGRSFTTVAGWRQTWRDVVLDGERYFWSKHIEFMRFLDVPGRRKRTFELSLTGHTDDDRRMLEEHGWIVRDAAAISSNTDLYRDYIRDSYGEFTVAKDQNVRLRSGWFSDRSATYLAAGRPVITQDTAFGAVLPTGLGLFAFSSIDDILAAIDAIESDYSRHSNAAAQIAREYFDSDKVLTRLLDDIGLRSSRPLARPGYPFPDQMDVVPVSRCPTTLPADTYSCAQTAPLPVGPAERPIQPEVSIVVVTFNELAFTRLCLSAVHAHTHGDYELIVVDNASTDGTVEYLRQLADGDGRVSVIVNRENRGFAPAVNQGLRDARGRTLILLNNDTLVPPGWVQTLAAHLDDPTVGCVGPVTNRTGNEAQIETSYRTFAEFRRFAQERADRHRRRAFDIGTLTMFCFAMRRDVFATIGWLDETFEVGLLEDDDYAMRMARAGYRRVCAEDTFVHHFDKASFGRLISNGDWGRRLRANQARFEKKWGQPWRPYSRRTRAAYSHVLEAVRTAVERTIPEGATVLVISRGDQQLLEFNGRRAWHFPRQPDGMYAGCYPANSGDAIAHLEHQRNLGAEFLIVPSPGFWWLDHYEDFGKHLTNRCEIVSDNASCVIFRLVSTPVTD